MKSGTISFLVLGAAIVVGAVMIARPPHGTEPASGVAVSSAQPAAGQAIEVIAKDGYTPASSRAKAGVPVALKIKTNGTLDCSAALRIPGIGWSQTLAPTGEVSVQIPAQKAGTTLIGVCSMGMKSFKIIFE